MKNKNGTSAQASKSIESLKPTEKVIKLKELFDELVEITTSDCKNRELAIQYWIEKTPFNRYKNFMEINLKNV
jgi:hypothetical protein